MRGQIPQLQLLFHPTAHRFTGHNAAQHAIGDWQFAPFVVDEFVDVFQKYRALREQLRLGMRGVVHRPLQAGIANVKCDKCHRRIAKQQRARCYPSVRHSGLSKSLGKLKNFFSHGLASLNSQGVGGFVSAAKGLRSDIQSSAIGRRPAAQGMDDIAHGG